MSMNYAICTILVENFTLNSITFIHFKIIFQINDSNFNNAKIIINDYQQELYT